MNKLILFPCFLFIINTINAQEGKKEYLQKVLNKIEEIESASYYNVSKTWEPGDTIPLSEFRQLINEYNNPADSTIGASYIALDPDDTKKLEFGYDGHVVSHMFHDKKGIIIDDFTTRSLPFRLVGPPFFNYTKSIIRYALNTNDNITTELKEEKDYYYLKLVINEDKQVEFFGKDYKIDNPYCLDPTSGYEIWISKSNDLPYQVRREMYHNISMNSCSNVEINKLSISDFKLSDYFPKDYEIRKVGENRAVPTSSLVGQKATAWTLKDEKEQNISLSDFKSRVLLVQFTGIGCGPCQLSIPFLNKLKSEFKTDDLDIVAIETWRRKAHALQNYIDRHHINYKLTTGTDEIVKAYQASSAPIFFILDENRVIRKIVTGYSKDSTDKEIENYIKELL